MALNPRLNDPHKPLVSVLIFNYNYGRYLRECFESVLAQDYENIEIIFSDNASTDDSWNIALDYQRRYPNVFFVARNRENFGAAANHRNCRLNSRGKYFIKLCSDDALAPGFTRACVEALESNLDAAFVLTHRSIINESGERVEEIPFYQETCKIPGAQQAAVYMMAAVNPSISQIMYRRDFVHDKGVTAGLAARYYAARIMDFHITCEHPIIYIRDALVLHRLHLANDSFRAAENMMEVIGPYVLNLQFAETALSYGHLNVAARLPESIEKVSYLAIRYCVRALVSGDEKTGKRYFHLAAALFPEIITDRTFQKLSRYWESSPVDKKQILNEFKETANLLARSVSYPPPPGSVAL